MTAPMLVKFLGKFSGLIVTHKSDAGHWVKSPPREEGWLRGQSKVAKPPYSAQTGWSLTSHFRTHSEAGVVSDHPVRSIKGGFAASY